MKLMMILMLYSYSAEIAARRPAWICVRSTAVRTLLCGCHSDSS